MAGVDWVSVNSIVCFILAAFNSWLFLQACYGISHVEEHKGLYKSNGVKGVGGETCVGGAEGGCQEMDIPRLVRLDGVKVGHIQEIELIPGKIHKIETVNMKPEIFEIPDFLSKEECLHIINLAEEQGLEVSQTHLETKDKKMRLLDLNGDKMLDMFEMRRTIEDGFDVYLEDVDIRTLYDDLDMDTNGDEIITNQEMNRVTFRGLSEYIHQIIKAQPTKKSRYSEQTWVYPDRVQDHVVDAFQDRIAKLSRLPQPLIDKFSFFQVVRYGKHGHYNAHHDSGNSTELQCCHLSSTKNCRICRFMTIMVYLNEVEEGGETAFPIANNETYDDHTFRSSGQVNLNNNCAKANFSVTPSPGKSVFWYNHFINEDGWLGNIDPYTWHGGCPVTKGSKWIMNRWIAVSPDREMDLSPL
ncbi:transmembrane prolyl 4-hydroxylase-like [Amphiura filiformis]|uniref:transmembrane prolyl 4-hydroxylase-like n=1 Tax=Amphiura filiformis TaxID=82378 RepID=UPI003B226D6A